MPNLRKSLFKIDNYRNQSYGCHNAAEKLAVVTTVI
jgi:hypothetical protein